MDLGGRKLGGDLPTTLEKVKELRVKRLDTKTPMEPTVVTEPVVGVDTAGHSVSVVSSPKKEKRNVENAYVSFPNLSGSNNEQEVITPQQTVQDLKLNMEGAAELITLLETALNIAPTMACLRALNVRGMSPESVQLFAVNRGGDLTRNKLILNNGTPPARLAIPVPGKEHEFTSIVPSIIPAKIKTHFPDPKNNGQWITMETPDREPSKQERRQVHQLVRQALKAYYGLFEVKNTTRAITVKDVAEMVHDLDEQSLSNYLDEGSLSLSSNDQEVRRQAQQALTSSYVPLLEGLGAAAEFVARSTGMVANTAVETLQGGAEGAITGGIVGGMPGVLSTVIAGPAAMTPLGTMLATKVGALSGAGGGLFTSYARTGEPPKKGDNTDIAKGIDGAILGGLVGGIIGPLAATSGVPMVTLAAGAAAGGAVGMINRFPHALKSSLNYFSPQQAWKESVVALSRWADNHEVISLLKQANEADQKIKADLEKFFKPFEKVEKYQKIKTTLVGQLDKNITERTTFIKQLQNKIKEQKANAIPTSGPANRTRIRL